MPESYQSKLWDKAFPRLKKNLFFFLILVFSIGNTIDIFNLQSSSTNSILYINSIYISFSLLLLTTYFFGFVKIKLASFLAVYSILVNIIISLVLNFEKDNFELLFLRESIILGILIIPAGFILEKKHVIYTGLIIFICFIYVIKIQESIFLKNNFAVLSMAYISYVIWIYYLLFLIEKWFIKQQELIQKLERRNKSLDKKTLELDNINKTKDRLFSIIAHDLRNPLNGVYGFSNLLIRRKNKLSEEKKEHYLKIINRTAEESILLLENLYNWATTQTDDINFNPSEFNLQSVINSITEFFSPISLEKEILLSSKFKKNLSLRADKEMLSTVLRNLISNSIKFSCKNGKIDIHAEENENNILFSVVDNGEGMSKETLVELFNTDSKVNSISSSSKEGTGLGLLICGDFINRHKGRIWAESEPNKGTIVYFTIPQ